MGLYKRKGSRQFWMTFRLNGRKLFQSTGTANRRLAERIYAKWITEITEGRWFEKPPKSVTMAEVIERYLREVSPHLSPTTHLRNEQMCNNLKEFLGQCLLGDVSPSLLSQYKAKKLEKGYRRETILREFGMLRRIFNIAIEEWELCKENPVRRVLKTLGRADNKRVRYLTSEEIPRLMQALPGWLKPIVILARHTGLRRGNLLDLTWEQVNLSKRLIVVSRTKNGEPIGMPLSETASKTLTELQRVRYLHSPFVFCDRDGKSHTPFKVSVAFKRACKKADIHDLRFHDLRHDFASNLVQSGVDIYTVRELLGHKDLRMTVRYCHLAPENLRNAVSMLDARESGYSLVTVEEKEKGCIAASP